MKKMVLDMIKDPFVQGVWLMACVVIAFALYFSRETNEVTIDAKHWQCADARPDGIKTKCVNYVYFGERGK